MQKTTITNNNLVKTLKQLFKDGNNYDATDEWLHSKLFAENSESLRIMQEYTNMIFLFLAAEATTSFSREGKLQS